MVMRKFDRDLNGCTSGVGCKSGSGFLRRHIAVILRENRRGGVIVGNVNKTLINEIEIDSIDDEGLPIVRGEEAREILRKWRESKGADEWKPES